jgi:hypothetical protein
LKRGSIFIIRCLNIEVIIILPIALAERVSAVVKETGSCRSCWKLGEMLILIGKSMLRVGRLLCEFVARAFVDFVW